MRIDVRGLLGSTGEQRTYSLVVPVALLEAVEAGVRIEPAAVRLVLTATPQGVLATGSLTASAHLECGRCLTAYTQELATDFAHLYVHGAGQGSMANAHELGAGVLHPDDDQEGADNGADIDTSPVQDGHIDLGPLLSEVLELAIPMKPLCRQDCQGLCPRCGKPRSEGTCDCKVEDIDPRLAVLANLLPKGGAGEPGTPGSAGDERKE